MTKRFTIVMVALALFVLMAIAPVSAKIAENGTQIQSGATVFIGEEGLNLTQALNGAFLGYTFNNEKEMYQTPGSLRIGWWASAAAINTTAPTRIINLDGRYQAFTVAPSDFVGYTGNWYLINASTSSNAAHYPAWVPGATAPVAVMNVQDPTLDLKVWDLVNARDVSGKSVPQGMDLAFQLDTNMYAATYATRNNTVWNESFDPSNAGAPTYMARMMPDGSYSTINTNGTYCNVNDPLGTNGTYIYEVYPNQQASTIWAVYNYTDVYQMTWESNSSAGKYGHYSLMYWNNTAVSTSTPVGLSEFSAKNFTRANTGLPLTASLNVAQCMDNWPLGVFDAFAGYVPNPSIDGFITIKVKDESGTTFTSLLTNTAGTTQWSLLKNFVNTQPWTWAANSRTLAADYTTGSFWETDAVDFNNQYAYPVGTYTVSAESTLNKMKDNHKNSGADYTGKTVSQSYTVTLVSDTVKIEANKDSVVRSKPFSITVTGKPSTRYQVWIKGISSLDGTYDNQAPMVNLNQEGVGLDSAILAGMTGVKYHPIGNYAYQNGAGKTIYNDTMPASGEGVAATYAVYNGTRYYCNITTSSSGTRTVEFVTNNWTKAQRYTIRVEQLFGTEYKSDEVDVKVEKGAVTIVAAGDQSYYLGEEIKFSGTNTESYKTYLFLVGPNLPSNGAQINNVDPRKFAVTDQAASTFQVTNVNGDNTWSWKWGTSTVALDAGTYTVYAVSQPHDKDHLENAAYGTVSIIIKKPFVSATASQSTVAKGDRIYITGTAEGDPKGVQIWILGKNYAVVSTEAVNPDASFKYEVRQTTTKNLYAGQYFVVVQHPMQNDDFDIYLASTDTTATKYGQVWNKMLNKNTDANGAEIFKILGQSSLQGSDAAEALVQGINDPNVDDTYTKLQFLVEEPVIRVDPIGDKRVGDKFTITAQTNLAVDDEILVQVYSSSFKPTQKSQSGEFSGATGTVKVTKGDSGMNKISFDVDSSTFKPDEYIVTEAAVIQSPTGTALFNVLEGSAPTAAPTVVVTTAAPVTAAPTQAPTQAPTAVPTTKSPGYGALIALIGLGAVAFIVVRRH